MKIEIDGQEKAHPELRSCASSENFQQSLQSVPASGVISFISRCNHSCLPNMDVSFRHGTGSVLCAATASRAIASGEELTIQYSSILAVPFLERQECLLANWGFECRCVRCNAERQFSKYDS